MPVPPGAYCDHAKMDECCPGCGHFYCPCGIVWDDYAEGAFFNDEYDGDGELIERIL